jgi:sec-independent protein translocase protein TatC
VENNDLLNKSKIKEFMAKYGILLSDIRKRILLVFIVFAISTFIGFSTYEQILKFLIGTLSLDGINIVFTSPFQFINLAISCGVATGIIIAFPLLIFEILSFLRPALKNKEYKIIVRYIPSSLILFLIGFIFGILIMKWQVDIFMIRSISIGIGNILDISKLLSVVLLTSVFMGLGFQFPIVLLILIKLEVVKRSQLTKIRKWVYLASFLFALLLPPDSILADIILSLPLIILYEITLLVGVRKET